MNKSYVRRRSARALVTNLKKDLIKVNILIEKETEGLSFLINSKKIDDIFSVPQQTTVIESFEKIEKDLYKVIISIQEITGENYHVKKPFDATRL